MTNTHQWLDLINHVVTWGTEIDQAGRNHEPRDRRTRECLAHQTTWDMAQPLVLCTARKMSYKFAFAEALWILRGDNRVEAIAPFAPYLRKFSDDGLTLSGAYGPPFVDQAAYVVDCLTKDTRSRQAVVSLWRPRPGPSRDVPCTLSLQWLIREGKLHCVASMRSSDAWLGVPYDVSTFSILSAAILARLRKDAYVYLELGSLFLTAGSQHLYAIDWEPARACLTNSAEVTHSHVAGHVAHNTQEELEMHLARLITGGSHVSGWMAEVVSW